MADAAPAARRAPSRRRVRAFALLAPLLFFALAEVGLRAAGALMLVRYRARTDADEGRGGLAIWAFGDSYTYGIGADDPATESYPAVVARRLAERIGAPVSLRNRAEPGLNSTGIVDRLERELADGDAPDVVLLLAGVNNARFLGQSGQFCLEERGEVGEVGAALTGALGGLRSYKVLRHVVLARRPPRATDRSCRDVARGFQHLDEGRPDLAEAAFSEALSANPASGWGALGVGLSLARMGRWTAALPRLEAADAAGVRPPALALARGFALRAAGRAEEARAVADGAHGGDLAAVAELLGAWLDLDAGRTDEARARFDVLGDLDRTAGDLPHGGLAPYGLDGRGWALLAAGRAAEAEEAWLAADRLGDELHVTPHLLGWPSLGRALLAIERGELDAALALCARADRDSATVAASRALAGFALLAAGRVPEALGQLESSRAVVPDLPLGAALAEALTRGRLEGTFPRPRPLPSVAVQQWLDPADTRLIEADLLRASRRTRQAGARLVVLTYPQPRAHDELAAAHGRVADGTGATFVDPRPAFDAAFAELGSWAPLLIPDGHPTTRGYAIVADLVVEALAPASHAPAGPDDLR